MPRYLVAGHDGGPAATTQLRAVRARVGEVADGRAGYAGLDGTELRRAITQAMHERTHSQDEPGRGQVGQRLLDLLSEHDVRQARTATT